ncbi:hypothetical protein BSG1_14714 [Bacillus sp. SG-1]|nr:hypothetical protein BSG1_14714 [Bacillus sp. SG-1]
MFQKNGHQEKNLDGFLLAFQEW